jgi:hypothetical protein
VTSTHKGIALFTGASSGIATTMLFLANVLALQPSSAQPPQLTHRPPARVARTNVKNRRPYNGDMVIASAGLIDNSLE